MMADAVHHDQERTERVERYRQALQKEEAVVSTEHKEATFLR